jgi:hypothetical protein
VALASGEICRFEKALDEDHCLFLDEMHFSPEAFLQCMEAEIADQRIEITIPWKGLEQRTMQSNFLSQFPPQSFQRFVFTRFFLPSMLISIPRFGQ